MRDPYLQHRWSEWVRRLEASRREGITTDQKLNLLLDGLVELGDSLIGRYADPVEAEAHFHRRVPAQPGELRLIAPNLPPGGKSGQQLR